MLASSETIKDHYQAGISSEASLLESVARLIGSTGDQDLTPERLASLDQFHVGGLPATVELARRARVRRDMRVLDAGSGLGGPSRYLAATFGCTVTGVDLAPYYISLATMLTERAGLSGLVSCRAGDLTRLEFGAANFDLVWTQHVAMNVRDRASLYRELRRVLAPGGVFAWYDVLASTPDSEPHYPVPWAETASASTLLTRAETIDVLESSGFIVEQCDDVTADALRWTIQQREAATQLGGPALFLGSRIGGMVANFRRTIDEGRVKIMMGVCRAA